MDRCVLMSYDGGCNWCGRNLTGKQRRWCRTACRYAYYNNHRWTQARREARRLNRKRHTVERGMYVCAICDGDTDRPEVNHIEPCLGAHGRMGCHHHQDNLEVLCHSCHVGVTNQQRADGMFNRAA